jgi:hypothetical protein
MAQDPTSEELRKAAERRAGGRYRRQPARYFASSGYTRKATPQTDTLPPVRVESSLAMSVADFGNANHLSASESVRRLLLMGLEAWNNPSTQKDQDLE